MREKNKRVMTMGFIPPDQGDRRALQEYKDCGFNVCCMTENYYKIDTPEYWNCLKLMEEMGIDAYIIFYKRQTGTYHKHFDGLDLHDYPAVKGIHFLDEPDDELIKLTSDVYVPWYNEKYSDLDFFMNTFGGCGLNKECIDENDEKRYEHYQAQVQSVNRFNTHIDKCLENINNKVKQKYNKYFSIDAYPLRVKDYWNKYLMDDIYLNGLATTAIRVKETDSMFGGCIQTYEGYINCRYPDDISDLRFQVFSQFAFGVKALCYFVYKTEETPYYCFRGMITMNGKRTPLYDITKQMNEEIMKFDEEYMTYDWDGTMLIDGAEHNGKYKIFENVRTIIGHDYTDENIVSANASRNLLIGCFTKDGDKRAYILTNFNEPSQEIENKISITFKTGKTARINLHGEEKIYELKDGKLELTFMGGDGAFVVIE